MVGNNHTRASSRAEAHCAFRAEQQHCPISRRGGRIREPRRRQSIFDAEAAAAAAAMPESWRPAEANASSQPAAAGTSGPSAPSPGNGAKGGSPGAAEAAATATATRVPFHKLFAFADSTDVALMLLGALGAVANGAAMPFMTVLFGNLIDAFGGALSIHDVVNRVSMVSLEFIYLAIASAVASFVRKFTSPPQSPDTEHARQTLSRLLHCLPSDQR